MYIEFRKNAKAYKNRVKLNENMNGTYSLIMNVSFEILINLSCFDSARRD